MGSTFFSLHYHLIFSTKERFPLIHTAWRPRLHSCMGGVIRGMNGVAEIVGGVADHVHLLTSLRPVHCIADVMRELKKESTNWVKGNFDSRFSWQEGYSAFSVSPTNTDSVKRYIADQEKHHAKRSFADELRECLEQAGIKFDEKYLL